MDRKNVININLSSAPIGIIFVALKLVGYIDWSWWWVTLPFWLPFAIIALVLAIPMAIIAMAGLAFGVASLASWVRNYFRSKK